MKHKFKRTLTTLSWALAALAAIAIFALSTNVLQAVTNTWDGGGGADYHWNTAANWDNDTLPANNGTAVIDATAAAPLIILDANRDIDELIVGGAGSLRFTSQLDLLTVRSAIRRLNADQIEFDTPIAIGADGVVIEKGGGGNFRFYSPITDNGNGYDLILDGGMDMRDKGTLDQPSDFSGRIVLLDGSLYMRADHAFPNSTEWVVSGCLSLREANNQDKLNDEALIRLYGGTLNVEGGAEDVGDVVLASGITYLRAGGTTSAVQANSLTRGTSSPGTRSLCRIANGLGENVDYTFKLDSIAGLGLVGGDGSRTTNKKIVPYMYDYVGSTDAFRTLITYDDTMGLSELADSDFVTTTTTNFPAVNADGNDNVRLSFNDAGSTTITLGADVTVNSLVIYADSGSDTHVIDLGGNTLTVNSGVIIANNDFGTHDRLKFQNGTIDVGAAELVLYSSMGANHNALEFATNITGTDGVTVHNTKNTANFLGTGTNLATVTLVECIDVRAYEDAFATNASVVGVRSSFDANRNVLRAYGDRLVIGEAHGTLVLKHGRSTSNGDAGLVIGGVRDDKLKNHIRLLGNGVLSPHSTTISDPDQTELDGGVIGLSAYDSAYTAGEEFTVDLHGGQVVIDIFADDNYDQLRVITSTAGIDPTVSLDAGGGTGSELVVRLGAVPDNTATFMIVQVDGATAITGEFSNAGEGDSIEVEYGGDTYLVDIHYNSALGDADGNDIVLSNVRLKPPPGGTLIVVR